MRMFTITLLLIALAAPIAAQTPAPAPQPVQVVATILSLSDAQVATWLDLLRARQTAIEPLQQQMQAHQQAIASLLQSSSVDPATLGQLVIEAHAIEQQVAAIVSQANAQFEQSLNDEQRSRLHHIREAAQVCPVVPALQATGLL